MSPGRMSQVRSQPAKHLTTGTPGVAMIPAAVHHASGRRPPSRKDQKVSEQRLGAQRRRQPAEQSRGRTREQKRKARSTLTAQGRAIGRRPHQRGVPSETWSVRHPESPLRSCRSRCQVQPDRWTLLKLRDRVAWQARRLNQLPGTPEGAPAEELVRGAERRRSLPRQRRGR